MKTNEFIEIQIFTPFKNSKKKYKILMTSFKYINNFIHSFNLKLHSFNDFSFDHLYNIKLLMHDSQTNTDILCKRWGNIHVY